MMARRIRWKNEDGVKFTARENRPFVARFDSKGKWMYLHGFDNASSAKKDYLRAAQIVGASEIEVRYLYDWETDEMRVDADDMVRLYVGEFDDDFNPWPHVQFWRDGANPRRSADRIYYTTEEVLAGVSAEKSRPQEIGIVAEEQLVEVVKPSPPDKVA